jgi:hypothetical protein
MMTLVMKDKVTKDTGDMTPDELVALADNLTDNDIQMFLTLVKDRITVKVPPNNDNANVYKNYVPFGTVACAVNNWDDECKGVTIFLEPEAA